MIRDQIPVCARYFVPVQNGPGTHPASYTMGTGSFPGVKRLGMVLTAHLHSADVKERVEINPFYLGLSWQVIG
jgi:hypothetical protein